MTHLARLAVALVWLYHGLWCKLLGLCPGHQAIVASVPGLGPAAAGAALVALGLLETALAAWVLSGARPVAAAVVQTLLLVAMNAGGLAWGRDHIADPGAMVVQNLALLALVWLVARASGAGPGGTAAANPWSRGRFDARARPPVLLFGRMHEDWRIEAGVFPPGGEVFCVASAGCTALALAGKGFAVTAVDVNPAQVDYVRDRREGAPVREGAADRLLRAGRAVLPALGLSEAARQHFLELDDPAEQARLWERDLETRRLGIALRLLLAPTGLRLAFRGAFLRGLPPRFGDEMRRRLRRGFGRHPNRTNPWAWRLLLGHDRAPEAAPRPSSSLTLACGDAARYLEACPPGAFRGFSLSNILDAVDEAYARRMWLAVARAAAPGARVVLRTFGSPATPEEEDRAGQDRAFLWGAVRILDAGCLGSR